MQKCFFCYKRFAVRSELIVQCEEAKDLKLKQRRWKRKQKEEEIGMSSGAEILMKIGSRKLWKSGNRIGMKDYGSEIECGVMRL